MGELPGVGAQVAALQKQSAHRPAPVQKLFRGPEHIPPHQAVVVTALALDDHLTEVGLLLHPLDDQAVQTAGPGGDEVSVAQQLGVAGEDANRPVLADELTQKGQENQAGGGCGHPRRLSDLPLVQDHQAAVPHDDAGPLPRQTACRLTQLVPDGGGALNQLPVAAGDIAQADGEGEGAGQARVPPHPLPRLLKEKNADGLFAYHFF